MSNLIAVAYPDVSTARSVAEELRQLTTEQSIVLEDMVVVERRPDGKIKLHQAGSLTAVGAAGGAMWGGLIGLLFLAPLLGMAMGAAGGAAAGALSDAGVDDNFLKTLGERLEQSGAAVVVLVRQSTPTRCSRGSRSTAARSSNPPLTTRPRRDSRRHLPPAPRPSDPPGSGGDHPSGVTVRHPPVGDDARVHGPVPRYEIRVRGRVSDAALSSFEGMDADMAPTETVLHGPVADQAGLHGLLDRIQSLGLELVEVRRLPPGESPP